MQTNFHIGAYDLAVLIEDNAIFQDNKANKDVLINPDALNVFYLMHGLHPLSHVVKRRDHRQTYLKGTPRHIFKKALKSP